MSTCRGLKRLRRLGVAIASMVVCVAATAGAASASPLGEIKEWPAGSSTRCVAVGNDGNAWFTPAGDTEGPAIGRITPSGVVTRFHEGLMWDHDMKYSSGWCFFHRTDGNLWFNDYSVYGAGAIGRITMAGEITEFREPGKNDDYLWAKVGPDDTMWFYQYEFGSGRIGRVALDGTFEDLTPNKPAHTEASSLFAGLHEDAYYFQDSPSEPPAIGYISPSGEFTIIPAPRHLRWNTTVVAEDDTLWGTLSTESWPPQGPGIVRVTHSEATEFQEGLNPGADPRQIVAGPGESMWFVDQGTTPAIGKVTLAGTITEYSAGLNAGAKPTEILVGPEGDIWFTDQGTTPAIGHVSPSGEITEYSLGLNLGAKPRALTLGFEGNLWFFDEGSTRAIGRITPAGSIEEWSEGLDPAAAVESPNTLAEPLAVGPGGNVWLVNHPVQRTATALVRIGTEEEDEEEGEKDERPSRPGGGGGGGEPPHGGGGDGGHGGEPPQGGPPSGKPKQCRKGFQKRKVHGKARCVKLHHHRRAAHGAPRRATGP